MSTISEPETSANRSDRAPRFSGWLRRVREARELHRDVQVTVRYTSRQLLRAGAAGR